MLASLKTKLPMAEIVLPTWIGLLVGIAYYFGAMVGFALTLPNHSVSTLWPPNSIMLAFLLLQPPKVLDYPSRGVSCPPCDSAAKRCAAAAHLMLVYQQLQ